MPNIESVHQRRFFPSHIWQQWLRKALIVHGLDKVLFEAVMAQLKAKAIRVKTGTLVDATIIASAREGDGDARWVTHKGRRAVYCFKALWGNEDINARLPFRCTGPSQSLLASPGDPHHI